MWHQNQQPAHWRKTAQWYILWDLSQAPRPPWSGPNTAFLPLHVSKVWPSFPQFGISPSRRPFFLGLKALVFPWRFSPCKIPLSTLPLGHPTCLAFHHLYDSQNFTQDLIPDLQMPKSNHLWDISTWLSLRLLKLNRSNTAFIIFSCKSLLELSSQWRHYLPSSDPHQKPGHHLSPRFPTSNTSLSFVHLAF